MLIVCRSELLEQMPPFLGGGEMIEVRCCATFAALPAQSYF
jgi:selenocysteine lyase/cysteine desulfurase